jgi:hypothetical protein
MFNNRYIEKVEIILTNGGLSTSNREFEKCYLTLNENHLIVSIHEDSTNINDPSVFIYYVFKLSEIVKFKTTAK